MITKFLTIKYSEPIKVDFKDKYNQFNLDCEYLNTYGNCYIGLFDSYDEAIINQTLWYELYGDTDICEDLMTIDYLERCYKLELDTNI